MSAEVLVVARCCALMLLLGIIHTHHTHSLATEPSAPHAHPQSALSSRVPEVGRVPGVAFTPRPIDRHDEEACARFVADDPDVCHAVARVAEVAAGAGRPVGGVGTQQGEGEGG